MKKYLFLLIICFQCEISFSQNSKIDSLFSVLKTTKADTTKVNTLNVLANEFRNNDPDTAVYFANEALVLATKINYKIGIVNAYLCIATAMSNLGKYDEALKKFNDALQLCDDNFASLKTADKLKNLKQKAIAYNNIGLIYRNQGNYPEALKNYLASLKIKEKIGDKKDIAFSYNNIGIIYRKQGNNSEALKNYFAALKIFEIIGDKQDLATPYDNIGNIYFDQGNFPEALKNYLAALKIREETRDKKGIAFSYNNIGGIYDHKGNYPEAIKNQLTALKIFEEIGYKQGIANSFNNIGIAYAQQKMNKEASQYLIKGLSLAKEIGSTEFIRDSYSSLAELYSVQMDFKQAYEHYKLYITYRDSLINKENTKKLVQSQMQYEFDKKEVETKAEQEKKDALAKAEIQRQKTIKNSIVGGTGILAVSALFSFVFYRRRRDAVMQNKITDSRLRAINAQMDDHFIFNCMQSIQSFIQKKDLQNADIYLVKFSKLIRKVLDNSTQKEITLADDLEALENYVELEKLRLDYPLTYNVTVAEDVNAEEIFIPPLLIQPFVENAVKHGLKGKNEPGEINIEIRKSENQLQIIITDNGTGRKEKPDIADERKSYGVPLTQERLNYLSASNKIKAIYDVTDIFDDGGKINGTKVFLKMPLI